MKTIALYLLLTGTIILGIYAWMQQDSADLFRREAAERHGQSGAIGGGYGNSGRD